MVVCLYYIYMVHKKLYKKATICVNELITSFSPIDIKCKKVNVI